jgi:hypothetical protein
VEALDLDKDYFKAVPCTIVLDKDFFERISFPQGLEVGSDLLDIVEDLVVGLEGAYCTCSCWVIDLTLGAHFSMFNSPSILSVIRGAFHYFLYAISKSGFSFATRLPYNLRSLPSL